MTATQEATPDEQASDHSDEDGEFFVKKRDNSIAQTQLDEYLASTSTETMTVAAWQLIKRLFFETNTPLPASLHASACSVQLGITSPAGAMLTKGAVRDNLPPAARVPALLEFKMAPDVKTRSNTFFYKRSLTSPQ